jgi:uridine kinase
MKHTYPHPHRAWRLLTETIWHYTENNFPKHKSVHIDEISKLTCGFVNQIPDGWTWFVSFTGLPWVGKSSHVHHLERETENALGFQAKQDHIVYRGLDQQPLEVWWVVCTERNNFLITVHADHFFRAIGSDRRELMLQNLEACRKLWGNPSACIRFIRDIFSWNSTDVKIYLWTDIEKRKKESMGQIELKTPHVSNEGKRVIIAEWVNVWKWASKLSAHTSIEVLKILFNVSLETSLIRVLRRDHERKWYAFHDILEHRLREYYYILKLYIEPALRDPETILFHRRRDIPPFSRKEIQEITSTLKSLKKQFSEDPYLTIDQRQFIHKFIWKLQTEMNTLHWVSEDEMNIWRLSKVLKNEEESLLIKKAEYEKALEQVNATKARIHAIEKKFSK